VNALRDIVRRAYERLVTGANVLQSPLLFALRVYFFWQLFLTGKGKLSNIGKVSEFFTSRFLESGGADYLSFVIGSHSTPVLESAIYDGQEDRPGSDRFGTLRRSLPLWFGLGEK
jgi:hypothetical protein